MSKRFITRSKKYRKVKIIIWLSFFLLALIITFNLLFKLSLKTMNETINIVNTGLNKPNIINIDLLNPNRLLSLSLNHLFKKEYQIPNYEDSLEIISKHDNDKKPLVYIYNTHQTEGYDTTLSEAYNIKYTVTTASYILRDYLKEYNIPCYIEQENMGHYLRRNNLLYKHSYRASRYYLENRIKEYPTLRYFIDIHRDSIKKDRTTVNIDGKNYAKVLFVVGMNHDNYHNNLEIIGKINEKIDPKISRGIIKKSGKNVNGIYNQDISSNVILIELGGVDNTIEEVNNTLGVISKSLFEYISEVENGKKEE